MHRFILKNIPKGLEVDHINHNGLDNRRCNIRIVTSAQNKWNSRFASSFKGARFHKDTKKWEASIRHNGKRIYLGSYKTIKEANSAYKKAKLQLRGLLS